MGHIEFLVEEPSAEAFLRNILPKVINRRATYKIIAHQGKGDLLKKLDGKLRSYSKILSLGDKVVVLVDQDKEECIELKENLDKIALNAGLSIKSKPEKDKIIVVNRIAIEELEAWFLGDESAIKQSYINVRHIPKSFKNPDNLTNSWERLEALLRDFKYRNLKGKIEVAKKISEKMDPAHNLSASFRCFLEGIEYCLQ
jgi:hypothetical protein